MLYFYNPAQWTGNQDFLPCNWLCITLLHWVYMCEITGNHVKITSRCHTQSNGIKSNFPQNISIRNAIFHSLTMLGFGGTVFFATRLLIEFSQSGFFNPFIRNLTFRNFWALFKVKKCQKISLMSKKLWKAVQYVFSVTRILVTLVMHIRHTSFGFTRAFRRFPFLGLS